MTKINPQRRHFLIQVAVAVSALPALAGLASQQAHAALPPLPLNNAQAKALNYVEDATKVTHSMFKAGSTCENCQFFAAAIGACAIFPGFAVAPKGWCSGWAKKA